MLAKSNSADHAERAYMVIRLIAVTIIVFFIWAGLAPLDEIVRAPGKVVPSSKAQVIQSLEGGILKEVRVWEGKKVEQGEVLARLSDAKFEGSYRELEAEVVALEARLMRLSRELEYADSFQLPERIIERGPEVALSESQNFKARRAEYVSAKASLVDAVSLHAEKVTMLSRLSKQQIAPEIDLLNARQAHHDAKSSYEAFEAEYKMSRSEEYGQTLTELNKSQAALDVREDQLKRTTLTAPVRGIVNEIKITTIGGVAPPGEPILELTPLDDELRIEAKVLPQDVAFIRPDMDATVKLTAYDYTVYGSLSGKVAHVSADTFEDTEVHDAPPYYKVLINVEKMSLSKGQKDIEVRPGMIADTELHIGRKTVLKYLLKPLFKAKEAFREP